MDIAGLIFIWIGVIFCAIGVLGIWRFKSVYNRLHATGVISTLGMGGLLIGAALIMPEIALKLLVLGVFVLVTAPSATQAIALAIHMKGEEQPDNSGIDAENSEKPVKA